MKLCMAFWSFVSLELILNIANEILWKMLRHHCHVYVSRLAALSSNSHCPDVDFSGCKICEENCIVGSASTCSGVFGCINRKAGDNDQSVTLVSGTAKPDMMSLSAFCNRRGTFSGGICASGNKFIRSMGRQGCLSSKLLTVRDVCT